MDALPCLGKMVVLRRGSSSQAHVWCLFIAQPIVLTLQSRTLQDRFRRPFQGCAGPGRVRPSPRWPARPARSPSPILARQAGLRASFSIRRQAGRVGPLSPLNTSGGPVRRPSLTPGGPARPELARGKSTVVGYFY